MNADMGEVVSEARLHAERGRALKREGRTAQAVAELEAALRIQPRYYRALIGLGDIWLRDGDYERAATAARMALAVDGEGAAAHLELSYANRGLQERARIEIGGEDYAAKFYQRPPPPTYALISDSPRGKRQRRGLMDLDCTAIG